MKKLFALLAVAFGVMSCQTDVNDFGANVGGEQDVNITVSLPEATRANSALGAFENVDMTKYDIRYIFQVFNADGTANKAMQYVYSDETTVTFPVRLIAGREYNFAVWADLVKNGEETNDNYTIGETLKDISLNNWAPMDETRDAYTGKWNDTFSGAQGITIPLTRPFAKLRVVTTDMKELLGVEPTTAMVKYTTNYYAKFNAFAQAPESATSTKTHETFTIASYDESGANKTLFADYIFATEQQETVNFELSVFDQSDVIIGEVKSFTTAIPVKRNTLTTIEGNILTVGDDITVKVEEDFEAPEYEYIIDEDPASGVVMAVANTANGLATIAEMIAEENLAANAKIALGGDIDLSDLAPATRAAVVSNWTPIGTSENPFTGVFDGRGYTIKNLTLVEQEAKEGKAYIGFFGYAKDATIKNVTFENVYINIPCLDIDHSQGHIGAVVGSLEGTSTIENVTVKGDIQVYATQDANGASRVAVVAGGNSYGNVTIKNVHVIANDGSYLKANNNTGAIAGQLQGKTVYENCSSNIDVTVNKFFAGGIVGLAGTNDKFINCHTTGNVAVVAGRSGKAHDHYRVGGIAGGWADGKSNVLTLENCSYTGTLTGINADGSVAEVFDYMGYVGRGYTLNGCQGSKVVIDGTEFVQKYNTAAEAGIYTINGCTPVSTADELVAALEANEGVIFMNDIKIEPASMSNAYGTTGINVKNGQTIDGNGYTLNIKGAGGTWDSGINTTGGIIRNITVTGSFRGIFINHTSDYSEKVVLENVTLTGVTYTISCDQGLYQTIEATNCAFYGWTSFAKTAGEAKFVNCYFGEGSGYKYCRPYSNTEFVGCTFCPGYAVDKTRATVTFTDCIWEE